MLTTFCDVTTFCEATAFCDFTAFCDVIIFFDINTIILHATHMPTLHATLTNKMETVRINKMVNVLHPLDKGHYTLGVNSYEKCLDCFVLAGLYPKFY